MGRPKGGKNKEWSAEEKLKVIRRVLEGETSSHQIQKHEGINSGMISTWIKKYQDKGIEGLINKRKPGNPLTKFQSRKNLTELEQLQYENMKLRIENERLKKGYTNEEAMSIRQKKSSKKNMK
jgi:transposase-like protein